MPPTEGEGAAKPAMPPPPPRFAAPPAPTDGAADCRGEGEDGGGGMAGAMAPPPSRPPSTAAEDEAAARKRAAIRAAAAAAVEVTPAQRERAVAEAAAAAAAVPTSDPAQPPKDAPTPAAPPAPAAPAAQRAGPPPAAYEEPEWGGTPEGVPYRLEILKGGQEVGVVELGGRSHHTFGRTPNCHVTLEHPSSSRLHAIVQVRAELPPLSAAAAASAGGDAQPLCPHPSLPASLRLAPATPSCTTTPPRTAPSSTKNDSSRECMRRCVWAIWCALGRAAACTCWRGRQS